MHRRVVPIVRQAATLRTVWSVLGLVALGSPAPVVFELPAREAMLALVVSPGRAETQGDATALLRAWATAVDTDSDLRVLSPEQAGLDVSRLLACGSRERLSCWTREIEALGGVAQGRLPVRYLMVLSLSRGSPRSQLTGLLIDLADARRQLDLRPDEAEDAIYTRAARTRAVELRLDEPESYAAAIEQILDGGIQSALDSAGRWGVLGSIDVQVSCSDCVLELDRAVLGTTDGEVAQVVRVPPGRRHLVLRRAGRIVWSLDADVAASQRLELVVPADALVEPGEPPSGRDVLRISGGVAVAAGLAGAVAGLVALEARPPFGCISRAVASECVAPDVPGDATRPLLAIGTGAGAAGVTWVVASMLQSDDASPMAPWIAAAVGVAVGAVGAIAVAVAAP